MRKISKSLLGLSLISVMCLTSCELPFIPKTSSENSSQAVSENSSEKESQQEAPSSEEESEEISSELSSEPLPISEETSSQVQPVDNSIRYDFVNFAKKNNYTADAQYGYSAFSDLTKLAQELQGCLVNGENIISSVTSATKVYPSYQESTAKYGIKFGTSSVDGVLEMKLTKAVSKVRLLTVGWKDTDTVKVNNETAVKFSGGYVQKDPYNIDFDFSTPSDSIKLTYHNRGFLAGMSFMTEDGEFVDDVPVSSETSQGTSISIIENSESYSDYYTSVSKKSGEALLTGLNTLLKQGHTYTTYANLRQYFAQSDDDLTGKGKVRLFYCQESVNGSWNANIMNREHVWPKSLGGFGEQKAGADLHHLRPANPSINTSRGNKPFGEVADHTRTVKSADYLGGYTDGTYFEPRDTVKGDVARIIFYLLARYEELIPLFEREASTPVKGCSYSLLLKWHELDPVDAIEQNRNNVAYRIQGNRNPFIDHPEFARLIWNGRA